MATNPLPPQHVWWRPEDIAYHLHAKPHGKTWRGPCPAHGGDNPEALSIREGKDKYGNPCTLLHCFAHDCDLEDICEGLGIYQHNLFAIRHEYAKQTQNAPRARSPRIDRLKTMEDPTPGDIAQIMLEEMIVSDPEFIETCEPARKTMWALAQASPQAKEAFTQALHQARLNAIQFWRQLARAMEQTDGTDDQAI